MSVEFQTTPLSMKNMLAQKLKLKAATFKGNRKKRAVSREASVKCCLLGEMPL